MHILSFSLKSSKIKSPNDIKSKILAKTLKRLGADLATSYNILMSLTFSPTSFILGYKCPDPKLPPEACTEGYYADATGTTFCIQVPSILFVLVIFRFFCFFCFFFGQVYLVERNIGSIFFLIYYNLNF